MNHNPREKRERARKISREIEKELDGFRDRVKRESEARIDVTATKLFVQFVPQYGHALPDNRVREIAIDCYRAAKILEQSRDV